MDYYVIILISIGFSVLLSIVVSENIEMLNVVLIARIIPKFMQFKRKKIFMQIEDIYMHTYHRKC